ncbi:uncharacterized protein EMH_0003410 [Eimeria mitis]|uniref:Uncharacterized protein n=1 Tax=Eimeria mitis TaxID=44415 RepID=U6K0H0_9EIME|nr:uncharacterized protein EMH_0003410 [Eimeria mitis]CDJ29258.1 hypothetical protein, conserved [Eimeria mitis]
MAERTKGTEGAAGGQQPVHEKPESTAAAAQPAAAAAASTATAAPSPAAASGTGQGPEGSGGQQPVHEKPESTAAAAQPAAGAAASTATAAPSPAAASGTGKGPEGSGIESISKEPYEKGMGKLYTEGQHIVQMLQESLRASRGLKSAEDISAKLRGEIVKDVEALRDTLHKEHQNLTLLRKYEREQDALLKAQLGYLMPSGIEETAEGEEEAAEPKAEEAHAVTSAYTSEAAQLPDVSLLVAFFSLFLVLGL